MVVKLRMKCEVYVAIAYYTKFKHKHIFLGREEIGVSHQLKKKKLFSSNRIGRFGQEDKYQQYLHVCKLNNGCSVA